MTTHLAVTCKNTQFHAHENPVHGHRIRIVTRHSELFRVQCDGCRNIFTYNPNEILEMSDKS
jgi:hypothetical protein